ncbi:MAG: sulfatase family protein [Phycisphaerales bacterium]
MSSSNRFQVQSLVFVLLAMLASASAAVCSQRANPPEPQPSRSVAASRPNILYIMADDHAAHALSCYGSKINTTPNLDKFASQGMLFTSDFCTNSICTPVRAVLMTGRYSHLNGVRDNSGILPKDSLTAPGLLKAAGYQTAIIGKWHLNRAPSPSDFDHSDILVGQGAYHDPDFISDGVRGKTKGYVVDLTVDKSMDWIHARDQKKPFLLYCHLNAPHRPWQPDEAHTKLFDDKDIPLPTTFDDDYATRSAAAMRQTMSIDKDLTPTDLKVAPPAGLSGHDLKVWKYQRYMKDYLRCIASIDDNMGRLMKFLEDQGLADNTIVIYTSDQGFFLGDHGWYDKRFMYEPALRSPLIVRYPAEVAPGSTCDRMVSSLDFAPTFLDFAGVHGPGGDLAMQGVSLRPLLNGKLPTDWRTSHYYHYYEAGQPHTVAAHYGVRTDRYKLIRFHGAVEAWEFYDLKEDPDELRNAYADPKYATQVADLKRELARLRTQYRDTDGPNPDAPLAEPKEPGVKASPR